jgi:hypothetical protein
MKNDDVKSLRADVERWAEQAGFTPQAGANDPDSLVGFIGHCVEQHPEFTHAHGTAIFAWCRQVDRGCH